MDMKKYEEARKIRLEINRLIEIEKILDEEEFKPNPKLLGYYIDKDLLIKINNLIGEEIKNLEKKFIQL